MSGSSEADRLPIVQYWHDGAAPDYIQELFESFDAHNPGIPHRVFDAPEAEQLIAERFGDREVAAFRACAVPAMQADYFRYCAGLALGGFYCDADVRCLGDLHDFMPPSGQGWLMEVPNGAIVNGLFAFGSPGHPFLELTVDLVTRSIEAQRWRSIYRATGPAAWTALHWAHRQGSFQLAEERAPDDGWKQYMAFCVEVIGPYERLSRAFEGVRVRHVPELLPFLRSSDMHFPYKEGDTHWQNVEGEDIYATPPLGSDPR